MQYYWYCLAAIGPLNEAHRKRHKTSQTNWENAFFELIKISHLVYLLIFWIEFLWLYWFFPYILNIFPLAQALAPLQYTYIFDTLDIFRDSRAQFRICLNLLIWFSNVIYFAEIVAHSLAQAHTPASIAWLGLYFDLI